MFKKLVKSPGIVPYYVANVVHGFGPLVRISEVLKELASIVSDTRELQLIVPATKEGKQEQILREETQSTSLASNVWVSREYGTIVDALLFREVDHRCFLERVKENQQSTQQKINEYFSRPFSVHNLEDATHEQQVDPAECIEFARNPLLKLPFNNSVMYTFGYRSDILSEMRDAAMPGYTHVDALLEMLDGPESARTLNFLQDPSTVFTANRVTTRTPLHALETRSISSTLEPGIYLTVTGVAGMREHVIDAAKRVGLRVYCTKQAHEDVQRQGIEATIIKKTQMADAGIIAVVGRAGWGAVNEALLAGKPLILTPAADQEDPEIILNTRLLVDDLRFAALSNNPDAVAIARDALPRIEQFKQAQIAAYGTSSGPTYVAKELATRFH